MNKEKIIQLFQWIMIILLAICCFWFWKNSKKSEEKLIQEDFSFNKTETKYVVVSNDKELKELKDLNGVLYDSIKKLSNVKEAIQIKYITKRDIDTVFITTVMAEDSIFHFSQTSDTINYKLDIKGKEIQWFKLGFSLQDSLMIVTSSTNDQNETTISHSPNTIIGTTTVYVPKQKTIDKIKGMLYYGIGVGYGYGILYQKSDIYIGINAGIRF